MDIGRLVLDYVSALVWPALIVGLIAVFKKPLARLVKRIAEESEEFRIPGLLYARFRKNIEGFTAAVAKALANEAEGKVDAAIESLEKEADKALLEAAEAELRALSPLFLTAPRNARDQAGRAIEELALDLPLSRVLEYSLSQLPGERVSAGIVLRVHLEKTPELATQSEVQASVRTGLLDPHSRVRFRFLQVVGSSSELLRTFRTRVEEIARSDENRPVRGEARRLLRTKVATD